MSSTGTDAGAGPFCPMKKARRKGTTLSPGFFPLLPSDLAKRIKKRAPARTCARTAASGPRTGVMLFPPSAVRTRLPGRFRSASAAGSPRPPLAKRPETGYIAPLFFLQSNTMNAMSTQPALTGSFCTNGHNAGTHTAAFSCGLRARLEAACTHAALRHEGSAKRILPATTEGTGAWCIMWTGERQPVRQTQGCPFCVLFGATRRRNGGSTASLLRPGTGAPFTAFTPQHP